MNADFVDSGFDLFLSDIGDHYLVLVGTSRGDDIVLMSGSLLERPTDGGLRRVQAAFQRAAGRLPARRSSSATCRRSSRWSTTARSGTSSATRCLSCGSCSMVCPTCYCFDVTDEVDFGSRDGHAASGPGIPACSRPTRWSPAARTSGDERASRIKFRFYHKQRGFVAEYGRPSCVGCGRCAAVCPAGIDIITVIEMIRGERDGTADQRRATCSAPTVDNPYQPHMARIVRIHRMVPDNHLFQLRFVDEAVAESWSHRPGPVRRASVIGTGEAPISISSPPTRTGILELCVRRVGRVTVALYRLPTNAIVGIRGPYGNGFPVDEMAGQRPADRRGRPRDGAAAVAALVRARPPGEVRQRHADVRRAGRRPTCSSARNCCRLPRSTI